MVLKHILTSLTGDKYTLLATTGTAIIFWWCMFSVLILAHGTNDRGDKYCYTNECKNADSQKFIHS